MTGPGSHSHRSLWHLLPELAVLLRAAQPRLGDLRALRSTRRPGAAQPGPGRLSLAGVGLWAARRAGDHPVLIDPDGVLTGTGLVDLVAARADQLHGVGAVLVRGQDDRHLVTTLVAAGVAGVDVVLVSSRAGEEELAAAQVRVEQRASDRGTGRQQPAVVLHSSGTTGRPHPRPQRSVAPAQLPTLVSLAAALGARRGEPMLIAAPLAHGHGLSALAAALTLGAPVLLGASGRTDRGLQLMVEHDVRTWVGLPTQLADLLRAAERLGRSAAPLRRLRRIVTGSAPLPTETVAQVRAAAGEVLVCYYGTTETGTATIARPADLAEAPATVGRPATGVSVRVRDRAGRLAPVGEVGQVLLRSRWRAPGEPEWGHSHDRGHLDEAGRLTLAGRSDGTVLVGGHLVDVAAVTAWLHNHPTVQQAQVRAVPHERLGTALEARVRTHRPLTELHAEIRTALGDAAAPRRLLPW